MTTIEVVITDRKLAVAIAAAGYRLERRIGANGRAFVVHVDRDGAFQLAEILLQAVAADPPEAAHFAQSIEDLMHFAQAWG